MNNYVAVLEHPQTAAYVHIQIQAYLDEDAQALAQQIANRLGLLANDVVKGTVPK